MSKIENNQQIAHELTTKSHRKFSFHQQNTGKSHEKREKLGENGKNYLGKLQKATTIDPKHPSLHSFFTVLHCMQSNVLINELLPPA